VNYLSNRIVVGALAACGLLSAVIGFFAFRPFSIQQAQQMATTPVRAVEHFFVPDPQQLFGKSNVRVLLVGLDYDYDTKDQETSKQSRSDIIMALNLDFTTQRVSELSIPRDMVATLPGGRLAKINQAQSEGGIKESQAVVADWLGSPPFDRYIVLRIDTAKDLVNAIGGVDLVAKNSDALRGTGKNGPIDYDDHWGHLSIHFKPGYQHFNGDQAVAYARFRHDWCSDPCRIMRQQQMIHAVLDKIEHNQFNTMTHVRQLLAVMHNDVETNFSTQEQISTAIAFAHIPASHIATAQVPYVRNIMLPDYGDSLVPDETAKRRLVASMLAPSETEVAAATPAAIRVRVENGTPVAGLGARVAADLRRSGFTVTDVRDAPTNDNTVTTIQSPQAAATNSYRVRTALGKNAQDALIRSSNTAATDVDVTIVLGSDIVAAKK
jgi:LCP family protein required for cell wall assembly